VNNVADAVVVAPEKSEYESEYLCQIGEEFFNSVKFEFTSELRISVLAVKVLRLESVLDI
jgi:hypothetical protein